jgi:hypothetical protein
LPYTAYLALFLRVWVGANFVAHGYPKLGKAKARNIKRDNRIAVSIRNEHAHKVALFAGNANILDDRDHVLVRRIAARYTPPDKVDGFLSGLEANRVIVRVKPIRTISWDFTKSGN